MKLTVNTSEIEHFEELMREAPQVLDGWLARADAGAVAQLEAAVKLGTPSCYGTLVNSIFGAPADAPLHGGIVGVSPPADVYGAAVEYGTRPHFPSEGGQIPASLVLWVMKRFGASIQSRARASARAIVKAAGRGKLSKEQKAGIRKGAKVDETLAAATAVAWGIYHHGTPAHHMFSKAIEAEQANIQAIYGVAVDSAFGELQTGL